MSEMYVWNHINGLSEEWWGAQGCRRASWLSTARSIVKVWACGKDWRTCLGKKTRSDVRGIRPDPGPWMDSVKKMLDNRDTCGAWKSGYAW